MAERGSPDHLTREIRVGDLERHADGEGSDLLEWARPSTSDMDVLLT
jgi:hypothetical protein